MQKISFKPSSGQLDLYASYEFKFFLKGGEKQSDAESNLFSRINNAVNCFINNSNFREKIYSSLDTKFEDMYKEIKIFPCLNIQEKWDNNISLYNLSSIEQKGNISLNEFKRVISEQNIKCVFVSKSFLNYSDLCISKTILSDYLTYQYDKYTDAIYSIIKDDIECYNNFIKKVDLNLPAYQKYLCVFNNIPLVSEISYMADIEACYILEILLILHIDEIIECINKYDERKKDEYNNWVKELESKAELCIKEIKDELTKDMKFKILNKEDKEIYYKSYIKSYLNDISNLDLRDELLRRLSLSINKNGVISFRGYEGRRILEEILNSIKF